MFSVKNNGGYAKVRQVMVVLDVVPIWKLITYLDGSDKSGR